MIEPLPYSQLIDITASLAFASARARAERLNERKERDHHKIWDAVARQNHYSQEPSKPEQVRNQHTPAIFMNPLSHIQIVNREHQDYPDDSDGSPQTIFRQPSFSQQVQQGGMAGYHPGIGIRGDGARHPAPPASLANLTSGTTFAAAARQAELNAARASRKKAKEADDSNRIPDIEPVSLGALKFTKSCRGQGSRSTVWKPLHLGDLPDSSEDDENMTYRPLPSKPKDHYPKLEQGPPLSRHFGGNTENRDKRADMVETFGTSQTPTPPPQMPITAIKTSFSPSAHGPFDRQYEKKWDPDAPPFKPSMMPFNQAPSGANLPGGTAFTSSGMPVRQTPWAAQQMKENTPMNSRTPSVAGTSSKVPTTAPQMKSNHSDDPFTEQVSQLALRTAQGIRQPSGQFADFAGQQYRIPSSQSQSQHSQQHLTPPAPKPTAAGQKHPLPGVKGTMDFSFRFPHSVQPSMNARSPSGHLKTNADAKATVVPAVPKQANKNTSTTTYQRDPKPYTSFSNSSKKEMLLQNLEEMVKVSEAQGNLPSSTRTVLYDPMARQADNQSRVSNQHYRGQSELDKESLKTSDPLPWKDRPVDIFNSPTDWREPPSFPPGLAQGNEYIYSLAQQPKPVERSLDDLERWWTTDNRAQGLSRVHLDQINAVQRQPDSTPTRQSVANSMESLSSPPSGRTASFIAAIGSERSPKKAATVGSSIDSDGMTQLLKGALINLQSYVDGSGNDDYFGRFARVPEWCIDKSPGGNDSYFGDWGSPPSRVGRDPRYRPTYHEGRYTVFEELDRRGGRELRRFR